MIFVDNYDHSSVMKQASSNFVDNNLIGESRALIVRRMSLALVGDAQQMSWGRWSNEAQSRSRPVSCRPAFRTKLGVNPSTTESAGNDLLICTDSFPCHTPYVIGAQVR